MLKPKFRRGQRVLYYGEEKKVIEKLLMKIADRHYWYYQLEGEGLFTLESELKPKGARVCM